MDEVKVPGLILSRKEGERVKIGEDIWVEVIEVGWGRARLRIVAPGGVKVLREELVEEVPNGGEQ